MATIKNTITLTDRMSPVLKTVIKVMEQSIKVMGRTDKASEMAFRDMQKDIDFAKRSLDDLNSGLNKTANNAQTASKATGGIKTGLMNIASGIYSIQQAAMAVGKVTDIADQFTLTQARLDMMNDGMVSTADLQDKILASANRTRSEYQTTAAAVSKLGILAGDAFGSTEEILAFTELLNKSFVLGGSGIQEQTAAMYQLTQAMAAGKLQGDEFRSIMENAPMLADAIAKYTGKTKGMLKDMSREGEITSDIIKAAMFSAADDINSKFTTMPATIGGSWTKVKNTMLEAFQPVIERISAFVNSPDFNKFITGLSATLMAVGAAAMAVIGIISQVSSYISANWSWIEPIFTSVVSAIGLVIGYMWLLKAVAFVAAIPAALATAAAWMLANWPLVLLIGTIALVIGLWNQVGTAGKILLGVILAIVAGIAIWIGVQWLLNAALTANPIGVIIMAIAALIGIIIAVIMWVIDLWQTNMDFKYGIIGIWNSIMKFFDTIPVFFQWIGVGIANAFGAAKVSVLTILQNMANGAIDIINNLIAAVNAIPGVSIDPIKKLTFAANAAVEETAARQNREASLNTAMMDAVEKGAARDAEMAANRAADEAALADKKAKAEAEKNKKPGADMGIDFEQFMTGAEGAANPTIAGGSLDSVGRIDDEISITDEDIKLLKDIAATEFVNKYTTMRPEMSISFGDVRETADVKKILETIEEMIDEAYASSLIGGVA